MGIQSGLDSVWMIAATFMVLLMQVGFLLLEGGRVRAKNSINVAQKNIADLAVTWVMFYTVGFVLMFGTGIPEPGSHSPSPIQFLFHLAFCATSASIVSGGVAERISFRGYLVVVVLIATLIYPLVGRFIWGNTFNPEVSAWFANLGFIDFAGATVVHSVGAWVALGAIIVIGPRIDRFDKQGTPLPIASYNSVMSLQGGLILLLGWLGFNGGTLSVSDPLLQGVLMNTMAFAAFGALAGMLCGFYLDKGIARPARTLNGMLSGLVASTGAIHFCTSSDAILFGALAGLTGTLASHFLLYRCRIDDPVDVVATHGIPGILGTLIVAFVAPQSALVSGSIWMQLGVQTLVAVSVLIMVVGTTVLCLKTVGRFMSLRVSPADEKIGLNSSEHGETIGTGQLEKALEDKIDDEIELNPFLDVEYGDENSELTNTLNRLISRQRETQEKLSFSATRFQQFADTASDWLWETNEQMEFTYVSSTIHGVDSVLATDAIGKHFFEILEFSESKLQEAHQTIASLKAFSDFPACLALREETKVKLHVEIRGTVFFDEAGCFAGYRGVVSDITPRKAAEIRANFLAMHDELTRLPNRRAMTDDLQATIVNADLNNFKVAVAGVDLDGFKSVNDNFGHDVGDELLIQVGQRISNQLRKKDTVYRVGGDEFVLILNDLDGADTTANVLTLSQRIIDDVSRPYTIDTLEVTVGSSIGLALYPEHTKSLADLTRMADMALYAAKSRGKGCVVLFEKEMDTDARVLCKMETEIVTAMEKGEFYLEYQPMLDVQSNRVVGFEALLRWAHPKRGEIPPKGFISLAEKLELIDPLFELALDQACAFASTWQPLYGEQAPKLSVNVSSTQLGNREFSTLINNTIQKHNFSPYLLELEISGDVVADHHERVATAFKKFKESGISVVIDDFGSGRATVQDIGHLAVDKLKIDRQLISQLNRDSRSSEIIKSIVSLGNQLGLTVLAEGVEDNSQLQRLRSWNCHQAQGFHLSRPIPEAKVTELLKAEASGSDKKSA